MPTAEQQEVVELRFAAVRPEHDVVAVDVFRVRTARVPAGVISCLQSTPDRGVYDPRLATYVQHFALAIFQDRDQGPVTRESSDRLRMQMWTSSIVGTGVGSVLEKGWHNVSAETCTTT